MGAAARIASRRARVASYGGTWNGFDAMAYAWQRCVGRAYRVLYRGYP